MYVTYTAVRSLIGGHSAATDYSLTFKASASERMAKTTRNSQTSLGGQTESLRVRQDVMWEIETNVVLEADIPNWREFLDSVDNCETFTLDLTGTVAVPVDPVSVEMVEDSYSEQRLGLTDNVKIRFKVRVL